jgi:glycosyltransferase involved in cell wall biosynthesis
MGIPHTGGTYSVFRNLREGLLPHGVELRWIGVGAEQAGRLASGQFDGDLAYGTVVAAEESNDGRQGAALVEFFEKGEYEGVIVNALCGRVATNFVRYLDAGIRRIMIVHSITVGTYAAARAVRDYVHATVGVSQRIAADLVAYKGFDSQWTISIPNSIPVEQFTSIGRADCSDPLRILFLGRVEDAAKGCLLLPEIISQVQRSGVDALWRIAGDGPDLGDLERRCGGFANVQFLGRVAYEHVPEVLGEADVYLFPSRYEGFGISLVEAMASGCVPVASAIRGVTDGIVQHATTGFLFPIGNCSRAAEHIMYLAQHPERRREMSAAGRGVVRRRFSTAVVAEEYVALMDRVLSSPRALRPALDARRWSYPRGLRAGVRTYLPEGLKCHLRLFRERLHA